MNLRFKSNQIFVSIFMILLLISFHYTSMGLTSDTYIIPGPIIVSTESHDHSYKPILVSDAQGDLHVTWYDYSNFDGAGTDADIFYKRWNASTSSWGTTVVISTESNSLSRNPSLVTDSFGNIHITWEEGNGLYMDIIYKLWNASNLSWGSPLWISSNSSKNSYTPTISTDNFDNIFIAWADETDYGGSGSDRDIFYRTWNASMSNWGNTEVISIESTATSRDPILTTDHDNNIHVVWVDNTDYFGAGFDTDIFYRKWSVSIGSWGPTGIISEESTHSSVSPSILTDSNNNIHVVWEDHTDYDNAGMDIDIFHRTWNASTSRWDIPTVVTSTSTEESRSPHITVDRSDNIHLTWYDASDYRRYSGTDFDIFYKYWNATSFSWSSTYLISHESSSSSVDPRIEADKWDRVHIVWQDNTDYDFDGFENDIVYKNLVQITTETQTETVTEISTETTTETESVTETEVSSETITETGSSIGTTTQTTTETVTAGADGETTTVTETTDNTVEATVETVFTSTTIQTEQKAEVPFHFVSALISIAILVLLSHKTRKLTFRS